MRAIVSALVAGWLLAAGISAHPLDHRSDAGPDDRSRTVWSLPGVAGSPTVGRDRDPPPSPELQALPAAVRRDLLAGPSIGRRPEIDANEPGQLWDLSHPQRGPPTSG
jgi:hypothetical protein